MTGRYCFHRCLSVNISGGGTWSQIFRDGGAIPGLRFYRGGTWSQIFRGVGGGTWSQIFGGGGVPDLRFGGGVPGLRFSRGGYLVSDFQGGYPVLVKGKIFDSRFGLIHVQTGKKNFCWGTPPPLRNSKKIAMATRRAVCLLRSRRRTFLLSHVTTILNNQNATNLQIFWENERFYQKIFPFK